MGCFTRINNYYNQLTQAEIKIAEYITANPESAVKLNINELAEKIGCAPSSITKFAKKLEYRSLGDMRIDLMRSIDRDTANDFNEITGSSINLSSFSQNYIKSINHVFEETLEINGYEKFEKAAQLLAKADTVYLFGVGSSSIVAQDFQQKLIRLNKKCIFCLDGNFGVQNAMLATSADIAFAISYSGDTDEVNIAARHIRETNCPLISITRCAKTPLSDMSDLNLFTPSVEKVTRIASLYSRYACLFMVDVVFLKFAKLVGSDSEDILREYRELHKPLSNQ